MKSEKTAVILLNLGGPLQEADIAPFLFNFFMDENIIALPRPLRFPLAKFIALTRSRFAAREAYAPLGFRSPLLENTKAQAAALQAALDAEASSYKVFVAMRHWHPFADETAKAVKAWGPDKVVVLPLYPQYSTTTTKSALEDWARAAKTEGLDAPAHEIRCWFDNEGFITASAENIRAALDAAPPGTRLLLSAHGVPEKVIAKGDPYQRQCEQTAAAIVEKLRGPGAINDCGPDAMNIDWQICYQSRVGPLKWIGPSINEALNKASQDKKGVVVYPHAFVSEHTETLVELGIKYRDRAAALGLPYYTAVPTVGTHPAFIAGLAELVWEKKRAP